VTSPSSPPGAQQEQPSKRWSRSKAIAGRSRTVSRPPKTSSGSITTRADPRARLASPRIYGDARLRHDGGDPPSCQSAAAKKKSNAEPRQKQTIGASSLIRWSIQEFAASPLGARSKADPTRHIIAWSPSGAELTRRSLGARTSKQNGNCMLVHLKASQPHSISGVWYLAVDAAEFTTAVLTSIKRIGLPHFGQIGGGDSWASDAHAGSGGDTEPKLSVTEYCRGRGGDITGLTRAGIAHRRKRKRPPTEAASWARRGWAGSPAKPQLAPRPETRSAWPELYTTRHVVSVRSRTIAGPRQLLRQLWWLTPGG